MREESPLVSVIVPAFNAEKYIARCINSVLLQTYNNLELIVVDDGSTDQTGNICDSYASDDNRIYVIHKENKGVSDARNTGLNNAHGKYVIFLDSDDSLSIDIIGKCISEHKKDCLNIWGAIEFLPGNATNHEEIMASAIGKEEIIANAIYRMKNRKYNLGNYFRAVWGKLFDRQIIEENAIRFNPQLYMGEDAVFLVNYLIHISGINVISIDGYNYNRENEMSATVKFHSDLLEQNRLQYEELQQAIKRGQFRNMDLISISLVNFRWWMFTTLIDNAVKGVQKQKKAISQIPEQALQWFEEYYQDMQIDVGDISYVGKRYLELYRHREHIGIYEIYRYYLVPRVIEKIIKKLGCR